MSLTQEEYARLHTLPGGAHWQLALAVSEVPFAELQPGHSAYIFTARGPEGEILPYMALMRYSKGVGKGTGVGRIRYYHSEVPHRTYLTLSACMAKKGKIFMGRGIKSLDELPDQNYSESD